MDWYPWGPEALARAQAEDKPLLISIGYSSCHWCHVMAHESFDDAYIAGLMNRLFVNIKVDREERPDVDQVYMEAVQMMSGHGGWPLNVFCLPDGRPFAGGTYFPPDDRGRGIIPWPQLLTRVADAYARDRASLVDNATAITGNLAAFNAPPGSGSATSFDPACLLAAVDQLASHHDDARGGFGGAPKFPGWFNLEFLFEMRRTAAVEDHRPAVARRIDAIFSRTLPAMSQGGLRDHVGGGFHRYCVDGSWTIPHFEKMLSDNALALSTYARAWQRFHHPRDQAVLESTVAFLTRELHLPGQGFAASIDADSSEGEGLFHTWTPAEVAAVLGPTEGARFCAAYSITTDGNFEHGRSQPVLVDAAAEAGLAEARDRLRAARAVRPAPTVDPKRLTAWNALAISGLVDAAAALSRPDWLELARETADFLWENLPASPGRLAGVWYAETGASGQGTLDDHAFLADALVRLAGSVDLLELGASATYLARAATLVETVLEHFADASGAPGYFFTADDHEALFARRKEWFDNALPSGQAALLATLAGLFAATGDTRWETPLRTLREAFAGPARELPHGVPAALAAITADLAGIAVIKAGPAGDPAVPALLADTARALATRPARRTFLLAGGPDSPAGLQLCLGTQCLAPTPDINALVEMV